MAIFVTFFTFRAMEVDTLDLTACVATISASKNSREAREDGFLFSVPRWSYETPLTAVAGQRTRCSSSTPNREEEPVLSCGMPTIHRPAHALAR
jgi:hypothetical protein